ncbi:MAG: DUF4838 domain-containing protein [Verrucomicrobia bacterium]|nr:DUF4838 domain-containing protein [Verrucomicrobiota bacterium]
MNKIIIIFIGGALWFFNLMAEGVPMIVKEGKPNAQIVIADKNRPRMATLAALELQRGIEKISGARLPIVTTPDASIAVKIYVGKSPETEKLGIKDDGLKYGAYRIVSRNDWLALIGNDNDFDADKYPIPKRRGDLESQKKWDKAVKESGLTDSTWATPFRNVRADLWSPKDFAKILDDKYGKGSFLLWMTGGKALKGFWLHDEGGSLNAVYALLRQLGAHWFMAGELGEVLPKTATLEKVGPRDELVKPDYPLRAYTWYNYSSFGFDDVIWARRIGVNSSFAYVGLNMGMHGLMEVHRTEAMRKTHPEYYALIGGKRDTDHNDMGTVCYSSKGMEQEAVNYIRFVFDEYNLSHLGVWPGDGLKHCQCEKCKDKTASEMVWEFADRVAREVYKTHPEKLITCGAYTSYIDAPDTIEKFSPNLAVWISNSGRPKMLDAEHWAEFWARVEKWQSKMAPGHILRSENNRYHVSGVAAPGVRGIPISYPIIFPRATARELKELKGISAGEIGEKSQFRGKWKRPGLEHITLYVQSRFHWDADLDVDQVLDEYCRMFYGPAAKQMKAAIDFAEKNLAVKDESKGRGRGYMWNVSLATALKLRDLLDAAKVAAGDNVYGQRVQAVIADLQPREDVVAKYKKIEKGLVEGASGQAFAL